MASSVDAELRALRVGLVLSIRLNLLANIIKTKKKTKTKKNFWHLRKSSMLKRAWLVIEEFIVIYITLFLL